MALLYAIKDNLFHFTYKDKTVVIDPFYINKDDWIDLINQIKDNGTKWVDIGNYRTIFYGYNLLQILDSELEFSLDVPFDEIDLDSFRQMVESDSIEWIFKETPYVETFMSIESTNMDVTTLQYLGIN